MKYIFNLVVIFSQLQGFVGKNSLLEPFFNTTCTYNPLGVKRKCERNKTTLKNIINIQNIFFIKDKNICYPL